MKDRIEVTAKQAAAVIAALTDARASAAGNASRLAMTGLGETALWYRLDALEAEFAELLEGLQPALFLEQSKPVTGAVIAMGVAGDEGGEAAVAKLVADIRHQ